MKVLHIWNDSSAYTVGIAPGDEPDTFKVSIVTNVAQFNRITRKKMALQRIEHGAYRLMTRADIDQMIVKLRATE